MLVEFVCEWCGKRRRREASAINQARKEDRKLFCNRKCSGLARRNPTPPTRAEKRRAKAEYDRQYRKKNLALLKKKKREYHKRTYDPVEAAKKRKKRMPQHVEYCRRPEYKKYKKKYDAKHRARKFGEFAEVYQVLRKLVKEIYKQMPDRFARYAQSRRFQWSEETQRRRRMKRGNTEVGTDRL